jgi:hypothetical protein
MSTEVSNCSLKIQKPSGKKTNQQFEDKLKKDKRFATITSDPKFMVVPSQIKKVKVDKRFNKMRENKGFIASAHRDHLDKVYEFESDEEADSKVEHKGGKILDRDGKFQWNEESSESSDNEKPEGVDGEEAAEGAQNDEEEFWSDIQEDVKYAEDQTSRIAIQNLDWDHISAQDLFFLFNSFCRGEAMVYKVDVFPSAYGKEQMEHDMLYGPPKGIFDTDKDIDPSKKIHKLKNKEKKMEKRVLDNKVKALEDDENFEFNEMELRKYEAQKMKYYYGVVYCDSPSTAAFLYGEIDGKEFEMSNLTMDLRFIPDDVKEFPYAPKESCNENPEDYECNFFTNRAIGHTRVKLTWDEDDPKRLKTITKKFDVAKMEEQDMRDYLASSNAEFSSEENEDEIAKKRAIFGLDNSDSESDAELNDAIGAKKQKTIKEVEGDIKITFKSGFEDIGKDLLKSKKENEAKKQDTAYEAYQRERKEKKRERKKQEKEKTEIDNEMMYKKPDESKRKHKSKKERLDGMLSKGAATTDELGLLVNGDETNEEFKPDTKDNRFDAIYDKGAFNIDPTHKEFGKVGKEFVDEHRKRRRTGVE